MAFAVRVGFRRMFGVIENKNVARWSLGGNDARVLRHVPRSVHFTLMIDLDFNFDFATDRTKATKFCEKQP